MHSQRNKRDFDIAFQQVSSNTKFFNWSILNQPFASFQLLHTFIESLLHGLVYQLHTLIPGIVSCARYTVRALNTWREYQCNGTSWTEGCDHQCTTLATSIGCLGVDGQVGRAAICGLLLLNSSSTTATGGRIVRHRGWGRWA